MRRSLSCLLVMACFHVGCGGDPTSAFVGTYSVTGTLTFTPTNGSATTFNISGSEDVTKSMLAGQIIVPTQVASAANTCDLSATVSSSSAFTINGQTCPAAQYTDANCGNCTVTMTYPTSGTLGSGSLSGSTLSVTGSGTYTQSCSVPQCGQTSGTFQITFQGNRSG